MLLCYKAGICKPTGCTMRSLFTIVAALLLLSPAVCLAMEKLPVSTGEWKPYTSADMEGHGVFSELVTAAFKEAGIELQISFFPWKRCEAYVKVGQTSAAFPYSITAERKTYAYFSDPVADTTTVFFYNKKKHAAPIQFKVLNELQPYTIVGVLGYFYTEKFKKAQLNVKYVATEKKALELIFFQRYDLLPLSSIVGWNMIKQNYGADYSSFTTCSTPLSTDSLHLMVSRQYQGSLEIVQKFNAALARIRKNGTYQKIMSAYVPELSIVEPVVTP